MTITDRLTDKDPNVRAAAAGDLAAAATAVADAARVCRDRDARELLRVGERPADVGRTIRMSRAQITRYSAGDAAPSKRTIDADAERVRAELAALNALLAGTDVPVAVGG